MKWAVVESLGVAVFFAAVGLPFGCVPTPATADLQPVVAVGGQYGILAAPKPPSAQCENCGGRGVVGDGVVEVPCPVCRPAAAKPVIPASPQQSHLTPKSATR